MDYLFVISVAAAVSRVMYVLYHQEMWHKGQSPEAGVTRIKENKDPQLRKTKATSIVLF